MTEKFFQMASVTNKYIATILHNIGYMCGSIQIDDIPDEFILDNDIIRNVRHFIPTFDEDQLECLWFNYNLNSIHRNFEFVLILVKMMSTSNGSSRRIFRQFLRLLRQYGFDQLVEQLNSDLVRFNDV